MRSGPKIVAGSLLIIVGTMILLKMMGVITFSVWSGLGKYWPVLIIILGIAMVFRKGWPVFATLVICIIIAGLIFYPATKTIEPQHFKESVDVAPGIMKTGIGIHYGAGNLNILGGSKDYLLKADTNDFSAPRLSSERNDGTMQIDLQREEVHFEGARNYGSDWTIMLSPDVPTDLNLNYGAAEAKIDLRDLKADSLSIESGATSTEITFGRYPTKTSIHTGASSMELRFPTGYGAMINFKGGLASASFEGFRKDGDTYYSEGYDIAKENIVVDIEAGVSSVNGVFY
jgi:hypothetical protein